MSAIGFVAASLILFDVASVIDMGWIGYTVCICIVLVDFAMNMAKD